MKRTRTKHSPAFKAKVASATVRVAIFAKTLPELPRTGTLDLNLHFTGSLQIWRKTCGMLLSPWPSRSTSRVAR
jgi:hypothetical protein